MTVRRIVMVACAVYVPARLALSFYSGVPMGGGTPVAVGAATFFATLFAMEEIRDGKHRRAAKAASRRAAAPGGAGNPGAGVTGAFTSAILPIIPRSSPYLAGPLQGPGQGAGLNLHGGMTSQQYAPPLPAHVRAAVWAVQQAAMQQQLYGTPLNYPFPQLPRPIEDAGIRAGEIVAWRAWRVRGTDLFGCYRDYQWHDGEAQGDTNEIGGAGVMQGIYAWKERQPAEHYAIECLGHVAQVNFIGAMLGPGCRDDEYDAIAIGQVDLWGGVVEHEHGYRAEHAQIVAIETVWPIPDLSGDEGQIDHDDALATMLRTVYGVPALFEEPKP